MVTDEITPNEVQSKKAAKKLAAKADKAAKVSTRAMSHKKLWKGEFTESGKIQR